MPVQCYGRHYEAADGEELTELLDFLTHRHLARANRYRVASSPLSRYRVASGPDAPNAPESVQRVISDMRTAAQQWREAYPTGGKGQSARVNFANWITSFANRLSEALEEPLASDAVDPDVGASTE